jgi:hypothetical protein
MEILVIPNCQNMCPCLSAHCDITSKILKNYRVLPLMATLCLDSNKVNRFKNCWIGQQMKLVTDQMAVQITRPLTLYMFCTERKAPH